MKRVAQMMVAGLGLLLSVGALAQSPQDTMNNWLSLVDNGEYEQSWKDAAPVFQQQITTEKWQQALTMVRSPLGPVVSREVKNGQAVANIPGAPDGNYMVFTLSTAFENMPDATETVTVVDEDDTWKVVGYFIR